MIFLDNQTEFGRTFGALPTLMPSIPTNTNNGSAMLMLNNSLEKCKLDIFMYLCMLDYVGHGKVDPSLNVVGVYHQISEVKQVRMAEGKL